MQLLEWFHAGLTGNSSNAAEMDSDLSPSHTPAETRHAIEKPVLEQIKEEAQQGNTGRTAPLEPGATACLEDSKNLEEDPRTTEQLPTSALSMEVSSGMVCLF